MATDLESLNDLEDKVIMTYALYEVVEDLACERHRLRGEYHVMDTI